MWWRVLIVNTILNFLERKCQWEIVSVRLVHGNSLGNCLASNDWGGRTCPLWVASFPRQKILNCVSGEGRQAEGHHTYIHSFAALDYRCDYLLQVSYTLPSLPWQTGTWNGELTPQFRDLLSQNRNEIKATKKSVWLIISL